MKMVYQWKQPGRVKLSAQVVGERLEKIRKKHGKLTPAAVVADATDTASPLHAAFEWNDKAAAVRWREEQASWMIRMVVIRTSEDEDDPATIRAFVTVRDDEDESSYVHIHAAMADPEMREQVVQRAYTELQEWRKRYSDLKEFAAVYKAVDMVAV